MCAFECVSVSKAKLHVSSPKVWVHCWQHCDMSREVSWHKADAYFTIPCNSWWFHYFSSFLLLFPPLSSIHPHLRPYLPFCLPALQQQEQDPTNLYISNLPVSMDEQELENMLKPLGHVISTRILRDANGVSRGVGFARYTIIMILMWHGGISLKANTPATSMKAIIE